MCKVTAFPLHYKIICSTSADGECYISFLPRYPLPRYLRLVVVVFFVVVFLVVVVVFLAVVEVVVEGL